ncbi:diaminobutyrate acetyltransferase [Kibdelosporangium banguiense]|uniref:L-2,4-diaminobutyric acid acetyltransferase n=1 Tax=Kibdelosporangium banguiense TaxID=1365924 RepID=A0ABS4TA35_9PSEU|nr:diaminobutyrate acetyltransferase [Kibdelosporangium banguiense]MBP2321287.1 diaminobutyrate acetyltransferase [Kibdelosporangium banguiense]
MSGKTFGQAVVDIPSISDGQGIWRVARDSQSLDLNSSYAYLLWCRDFAATSAVVRVDGVVVGFVIGYHRPSEPDTLVVWQVAVDDAHRGRGIGAMLLDTVVRRTGARHLEATVTSDNNASIGLFRALAARWSAGMTGGQLFPAELFPDEHDAEFLFRIGPFVSVSAPAL